MVAIVMAYIHLLIYIKISNLSKGFSIFSKPLVVICVYISVVLLLECSNKLCIYLKSVPFSSKCVAKLCLKVWTVILFFMPTFFIAAFSTFCMLLSAYYPPFSPSNNHSFGLYSLQYFRKTTKVFLGSKVYRSFFFVVRIVVFSVSQAIVISIKSKRQDNEVSCLYWIQKKIVLFYNYRHA